MKFDLPYPPSANRYLRHTARGTYRTKLANDYCAIAANAARLSGAILESSCVMLKATLHPRMTKAGVASKTRLDLDNCVKVAIDALAGVCFVDDKQVTHLALSIGAPIVGGGLTLEVLPA